MFGAMRDDRDAADKDFERLMALHKYFLNADYMRDAFIRRIKREQSPADTRASGRSVAQIAEAFTVSRATVYRALGPLE